MSKRVLVCASDGIGHLNPMIVLSNKLASLGVPIRFVCPDEKAFSYVLGAPEAANFEVICLFDVDSAGVVPASEPQRAAFPCKRGFYEQFANFQWPDYSAHEKKLEGILRCMVDSGEPPAAVIFDSAITWAWSPASKLGIPTYANGNSAVNIAVDFYSSRLVQIGEKVDTSEPLVRCIPGCPPIPSGELHWRVDPKNGQFFDVRNMWDEQMLKSDGVLFNSCSELDSRVVAALHDGEVVEQLKGKVYAVGPLIREERKQADDKQSRLLKWLDEQPAKSVLFISFGTWETVYDEQVVELAAGLEASGVRFLWMESFEGQVAGEFKERVAERGLVWLGFAPQQRVLEHSSVGGFLTHCGWNSVVECVSLGGIPMIAWGLILDQPVNAALVAELGLGVEPEDNADGIVERQEVERVVRLVMEEESGQKFRNRALELKQSILSAHSVDQLQLLANKLK